MDRLRNRFRKHDDCCCDTCCGDAHAAPAKAEPIGPPKEQPKKMPAGEPPAKTQLDVAPPATTIVAPAETEIKTPF